MRASRRWMQHQQGLAGGCADTASRCIRLGGVLFAQMPAGANHWRMESCRLTGEFSTTLPIFFGRSADCWSVVRKICGRGSVNQPHSLPKSLGPYEAIATQTTDMVGGTADELSSLLNGDLPRGRFHENHHGQIISASRQFLQAGGG